MATPRGFRGGSTDYVYRLLFDYHIGFRERRFGHNGLSAIDPVEKVGAYPDSVAGLEKINEMDFLLDRLIRDIKCQARIRPRAILISKRKEDLKGARNGQFAYVKRHGYWLADDYLPFRKEGGRKHILPVKQRFIVCVG